MAELQEILDVLDDIKRQVADIEERIVVGGAQVSVSEGLSDISESLGLVKAGEFRSGKGIPGNGFSGVRQGWPGFVYGGETYNVVGIDGDTMQFGLRASDGVAVFGGGSIVLSSSGGVLTASTDATDYSRYWRWRNPDGTDIGYIGAHVGQAWPTLQLKVGTSTETTSSISMAAEGSTEGTSSVAVTPGKITLNHSSTGSPYKMAIVFEKLGSLTEGLLKINEGNADVDVVMHGADNNDIFKMDAGSNWLVLNSRRSSTGDPSGEEGLFMINTADNNVKIYADGGWRTLATW